MRLNLRVALVTGAATGIGRSTALRLAAEGAGGVVINYHTAPDEAEQVAAEARRLGAETLCVQGDLRDDAQVRGMLAQVEDRFGRLDVLVNNAGITRWVVMSDLESLTDDIWHDVLDVNLIAAFRCVRAIADAIVSLAMGGAFVTGQTLVVDGGLTLA